MGNGAMPITTEKAQNFGSNAQTITSMEVAEMVGKEHKNIIRDVRNYVSELNQLKIEPVEFFTDSTYVDGKGETRPCYNITKKGCEFIAHKLTGIKGTEFTARYINRFHDMEKYVDTFHEEYIKPTLSETTEAAKLVRDVYEVAGVDPRYIAVSVNTIYKEAGLNLPLPIEMEEDKLYDQTEIAKELGIMSTAGKPHSQAVGTIISMLDIAEKDKISTPYTNHGHSGVVTQYTGRVLAMVREWLKENDYPGNIAKDNKKYNVSYV